MRGVERDNKSFSSGPDILRPVSDLSLMKLGLNVAHVGVAVNRPCFSVRDHLKPKL